MLDDKAKIKAYFFASFLLFFIFVLWIYPLRRELSFCGTTMGTSYNIKVIAGPLTSADTLHWKINNRLTEISGKLSTYNIESEISQFNFMTSCRENFYPSRDFFNILRSSKELHELVGDVWDPTIDPLVNGWGFGKDGAKRRILDFCEIEVLLSKVGFTDVVIFNEDGSIRKGLKNGSIDLASIAKGFGVDEIALLLCNEGFENFLIEIGGEVYARGFGKDGQCWRVGISYPDKGALSTKVCQVVSLLDGAIATSGDYRNFVEIDGERYSHIIDPRTGYPTSGCIKSVSVMANNCTLADGLATALMLFNPHDAINFVDELPEIECIIMATSGRKNNFLKKYYSKGIKILER